MALSKANPDVSGGWDDFVRWAKRFHEWPDLDSHERVYKLKFADALAKSRTALQTGDQDWLPALKHAFNTPSNITDWHVNRPFLEWCQTHPEPAQQALHDLWESTDPLPDRIRRFAGSPAGPALNSNLLTIASLLLITLDPRNCPVFMATPFQTGYDLIGYLTLKNASPGARYRDALGFLDRMIQESRARGLALRDRLDAQSVLWQVTKWEPEWGAPVTEWPADEQAEFFKYRGLPFPSAASGWPT